MRSFFSLFAAVFFMLQFAVSQVWAQHTNLERIGVGAPTQAQGNFGLGVNVGILGLGVDPSNSDYNFGGRFDASDYVDEPFLSSAFVESGTALAGIVGGPAGVGIANQSTIFDIRYARSNSAVGPEAVMAAVDAAYNAGLSIVIKPRRYTYGSWLDAHEYLAMWKYNKHLLFVSDVGGFQGRHLYSAKAPRGGSGPLRNFMLVGGVDENNERLSGQDKIGKTCFVSRKSGRRQRCKNKDRLKYFFIVAPGEKVKSTAPGGGTTTDHSSAAAHVAGAAALLQGRWPHLKNNPTATANILFNTATDLGKKGVDGTYGWGLLNVERAFQPVGETLLYTTKKKYPSGTSGLKRRYSSPIGMHYDGMTGGDLRSKPTIKISMFDEYGRDYKVDLSAFATTAESPMSNRISELLAVGDDPAKTAVSTSHSFAISDAIEIDYKIASAKDRDPDFHLASPLIGLAAFEKAQLEELPDASWALELTDTAGVWSLYGGSNTYGKPFAFTNISDFELGGISSGNDLENPVLGFAENGTYVGSQVSVVDGVKLTVGQVDGASEEFLTSKYDARASLAGLQLTPAHGANLGIVFTQLREDNGLFGMIGAGALSLGEQFTTNALTLSAFFDLGDDWQLSLAHSIARTTQAGPSDLLRFNGAILSDASALAVSRSNLLQQGDRVSVTVNMPLAVVDGEATSQLADHLDVNGDVVYRNLEHDLREPERPIEMSLGYLAPLGEGKLKVGATAELRSRGVRDNEFGGFAVYSRDF